MIHKSQLNVEFRFWGTHRTEITELMEYRYEIWNGTLHPPALEGKLKQRLSSCPGRGLNKWPLFRAHALWHLHLSTSATKLSQYSVTNRKQWNRLLKHFCLKSIAFSQFGFGFSCSWSSVPRSGFRCPKSKFLLSKMVRHQSQFRPKILNERIPRHGKDLKSTNMPPP